MARYTGPSWKKSRRLEFSTLETGKELQRRPYAPGQHGKGGRRSKLSEYALQLREKQRIRIMYGLNEKQFYNTYLKASKLAGVAGSNFLVMLESRLDNIVYRMNFARTRRAARQLVTHGHILVDGKKVNIPSAQVKPGQTVELKEGSRNLAVVSDALESALTTLEFVQVDKEQRKGVYLRVPDREELNEDINESLVVEFYSR